MQNWATVFLPAAFGSAIQELAYWWQLRHKLSAKKYQEQMRSVAYWIIVSAMVIGSGIGTVIWLWSETVAPKDAMILGAGFPLMFKHAVDVSLTKRGHLGPSQGAPEWTLGSYFSMR